MKCPHCKKNLKAPDKRKTAITSIRMTELTRMNLILKYTTIQEAFDCLVAKALGKKTNRE